MTMAELPSTLIAKAVDDCIQLPIRIDELDKHLSRENKFVLFIADELDSVFLSSYGAVDGKQIIREIAEIGNTSQGRIHCIISGSSHQLRQLCFGKLPEEDRYNFPNYVGINLNSTKFPAHWIHPFLGKSDFDIMQSVCCKRMTLTRLIRPRKLSFMYILEEVAGTWQKW